MDLLIRVEIGPDMLFAINLIRIELILSSLQLFFGFSDFIISKISLESVGLKKFFYYFVFFLILYGVRMFWLISVFSLHIYGLLL